jgi:hypothetical protein
MRSNLFQYSSIRIHNFQYIIAHTLTFTEFDIKINGSGNLVSDYSYRQKI